MEVINKYRESGILNEDIGQKLKSQIKEYKLNLSGVDKTLQSSSSSVRAQYMYDQIQDLSPEERLQWMRSAKEKQILTPDVMREFQTIVKRKSEEDIDRLPLVAE